VNRQLKADLLEVAFLITGFALIGLIVAVAL